MARIIEDKALAGSLRSPATNKRNEIPARGPSGCLYRREYLKVLQGAEPPHPSVLSSARKLAANQTPMNTNFNFSQTKRGYVQWILESGKAPLLLGVVLVVVVIVIKANKSTAGRIPVWVASVWSGRKKWKLRNGWLNRYFRCPR